MPTYSFRCQKCEHEFSGIFPMKNSDGKGVVCPECGAKGVKRVYKSSPSLLTKSKTSAPSCPTCPTCAGGVCGL